MAGDGRLNEYLICNYVLFGRPEYLPVIATEDDVMRIGCFNRPWGQFTYDEALDGMKDAGFTLTGLVGQHLNEPFTGPDATPEYLNELKRRITDRGLEPVITSLRFEPNAPHE